MSAIDTQVGGNHYRSLKIQPAEFAMANGFNYCQSLCLRYLTRYKSKHGKEDLLKAKHCIELLIELEYPEESALESGKPGC